MTEESKDLSIPNPNTSSVTSDSAAEEKVAEHEQQHQNQHEEEVPPAEHGQVDEGDELGGPIPAENQEKGLELMLKLVYALLARPESADFRVPVDHVALGLKDYLDIVKEPMDLGTIRKKLLNKEYPTVESCARDIRLVWTNCMTYNQGGNEYYQLADLFAKKFEERYQNIRRECGSSGEDKSRIPSLEDKLRLSYEIFKIEPIQLGRILATVEKQCKNAVIRELEKAELLLNIDDMTPECFNEVAKIVFKEDITGKKKKADDKATGTKKLKL